MDIIRRQFATIVIALLLLGASTGMALGADPRETLHRLEANPFQPDVIASAIASLQQAAQQDPDNPWVYLALAKANLDLGYRSGSRYEKDNFHPQSLENARGLVGHALRLDPGLSRAHAMRARLLIIDGQYRAAWDTLNRAHELDNESFYPWYLMGVLNRHYREYDQSRKMLRRAESLATHRYQKRWVLLVQRTIAEDLDDSVAEERVHRRIIELFPERAHGYGNYGAFLLEQDRYQEAIVQFEKALEIQPYPLAEKQLDKARRLAAEEP